MILKVTDLKQYIYCPRIIYYSYCLPVKKKNTRKMEISKDIHEIIEKLEKRRVLKKYNINKGTSWYEKFLYSEKIGLSGKIDRLIYADKSYYPVDYKNSSGKVYFNQIIQITGYSLLVDEIFKTNVSRAFVFQIISNKVEEITITDKLKQQARRLIDEINEIIDNEKIMEKADNINKCIDCEYRRFCNDIE